MQQIEKATHNRMRRRWLVIAHVVGLICFSSAQFLGWLSPGGVIRFFAEPAGYVAALFLGAPVDASSGTVQLLHPRIDIAITDACSGFDFFSLVLALWVGWMVYCFQGSMRRYLWLFMVLPSAWLITLLGNVSRIVCATHARLLTPPSLSSSFDGIIHQSVGVVVFLSVLILFWKILTKYYERNCRA